MEKYMMNEMIKKIVFEDVEIKILNCYIFRYSNDKNVLRIEASENDTDFSTLQKLKENKGDILYFVGDELKNKYEGYTSGEFSCNYSDGLYVVEVAHISKLEFNILKNQADIEYLALINDIIL